MAEKDDHGKYMEKVLIDASADEFSPVWSPDEKFIVFSSDAEGDFDIYLYNIQDVDGENLTPDGMDQYFDASPTWSPDGKQIAFVSNRDGNYDIWVVNL